MAPKTPKPLTRVTRSGGGRSYLLDGEPCLGSTTIIERGVPKNGLIGWAAGSVADYVVNRLTVARSEADPTKVRIVADELVRDALAWNESREGWRRVKVGNDALPRLALAEILKNIRYKDSGEAAAKGTEVHGLAARYVDGQEVLVPAALEGYVRSYIRFLEEWEPFDMIVEATVVNRRWRYMGTFDLLAAFPGVWSDGPKIGEPVGTGLLDIKTSRSGIFAETALQLESYRNAESIVHKDGTEEPMPSVDWVAALHVRHDGYELRVLDTDKTTFNTFIYCKAVGDWFDRDTGPAATVIGPAMPPPIIEETS